MTIPVPASATNDKPNLLFVFTDQQRADSVGGIDGYTQTPNLDRLAARGMRFTKCITPAPVCMPARFSLLSGEYPHALGIARNGPVELLGNAPSWVRDLRDLGYRTAMIGKTHYSPPFGNLAARAAKLHQLGFDDINEVAGPHGSITSSSMMTEWWKTEGVYDDFRTDLLERKADCPWVVRPSPLGFDHYYDRYVGEKAVEYLKGYSDPRPWFCWVGFPGPHEPWDTPEPYASLHDPRLAPAPRPFPADLGTRPQGYLDQRRREVPEIASAHIARMRADYAGSISLIDAQLGAILDAIEARGELDRTAIIFSSDHGEMNGDAGIVYKNVFLDGAVLVPLIVSVPGTGTGDPDVVSDPVELNAVGPTFLDLASGGRTKEFGVATSLLHEPRAPRDIAISRYAGEFMVTDGVRKLVVNADGSPYLLFDHSTDPTEATNRVTDPAMTDTIARLSEALLQRLVETMPRLPSEHVRRLGAQPATPTSFGRRVRRRLRAALGAKAQKRK